MNRKPDVSKIALHLTGIARKLYPEILIKCKAYVISEAAEYDIV